MYIVIFWKSGTARCYNAGFENVSIMNIAEKIAEKTNANIEIVESNDPDHTGKLNN